MEFYGTTLKLSHCFCCWTSNLRQFRISLLIVFPCPKHFDWGLKMLILRSAGVVWGDRTPLTSIFSLRSSLHGNSSGFSVSREIYPFRFWAFFWLIISGLAAILISAGSRLSVGFLRTEIWGCLYNSCPLFLLIRILLLGPKISPWVGNNFL